MLNYSIFTQEFIFEGWDEFEPEYKEIKVSSGVYVLVEQYSNEELKIVQLISSNPQDYLREELSPGKIFKYSPPF
jgi:hypothetical protein